MADRVLRIFESELHQVLRECARNPERETGGELLGLWSHGDSPTVFLASLPAAEAEHGVAHFVQDTGAHRSLEREAWTRWGLQCVGQWHSHHGIGLHTLSHGDLERIQRYGSRFRRARHVELLAFLERERWGLRPFVFGAAADGRSEPSRLELLPGRSPLRSALSALPGELAPLLRRHRTRLPEWTALPSTAVGHPPETPATHGATEALGELVERLVPPSLRSSLELEEQAGGLLLLRLVSWEGGRQLEALFSAAGSLVLRRLRLLRKQRGAWKPVQELPAVGSMESRLRRGLALLS